VHASMRPTASIYTSYACGINVLILRTRTTLVRHFQERFRSSFGDCFGSEFLLSPRETEREQRVEYCIRLGISLFHSSIYIYLLS